MRSPVEETSCQPRYLSVQQRFALTLPACSGTLPRRKIALRNKIRNIFKVCKTYFYEDRIAIEKTGQAFNNLQRKIYDSSQQWKSTYKRKGETENIIHMRKSDAKLIVSISIEMIPPDIATR